VLCKHRFLTMHQAMVLIINRHVRSPLKHTSTPDALSLIPVQHRRLPPACVYPQVMAPNTKAQETHGYLVGHTDAVPTGSVANCMGAHCCEVVANNAPAHPSCH
jgi:hypothetical protein